MRSVTAIALMAILSLSTAQAELLWGTPGSVDVAELGLGAVEGDMLLTHQNLELSLAGAGLGFRSSTLHDHDAFYWMLVQPDNHADILGLANGPSGSGMLDAHVGPGAPADPDNFVVDPAAVSASSNGYAYWYATDGAGDLLAAGYTGGSAHDVFRWSHAATFTGLTFSDGRGDKQVLDYVPGETVGSPLDPITELIPSGEAPAACTKLLQEPAGEWYTDTHVRLAWDPVAGLRGDGPGLVTYTLSDADGLVGQVTAGGQYGHAILRATTAGAHTLTVESDEGVCQVPITVMASAGSTPPIWNLTSNGTGFTVSFTTETTSHYDVDAIVLEAETQRLVYAGKLHSHGGGVRGEFPALPGTYEVTLFAVAQGEGPAISESMTGTIEVTEVAVVEATPPPGLPLLLLGLAGIALQRRK